MHPKPQGLVYRALLLAIVMGAASLLGITPTPRRRHPGENAATVPIRVKVGRRVLLARLRSIPTPES